MSFYGKTFKKVKSENMVEIIEKMGLNDKIVSLIRQPDTLTKFTKNDDGTIQYLVTLNGASVLEENLELGKEKDFVAPDGTTLQIIWTQDGEILKNTIKFPDGKFTVLSRQFNGNSMKMEVDVAGLELKGIVEYEAV